METYGFLRISVMSSLDIFTEFLDNIFFDKQNSSITVLQEYNH